MKKIIALIFGAILLVVACVPPTQESNINYWEVTQFRAANGVGGLSRDGALDAKAAGWAQVMANQGYLSHSNLSDGVPPGWRIIGENVAVAGTVQTAQDALEASPPHRANLLNGYFNQVGIGTVAQGGNVWLVQVFVGR